MWYRAYIDGKMNIGGKVRWMMLEALPNIGSYLTRAEAVAQASDSLRYWRKHHKAGKLRGKYGGFRSRVVKKQ